MTWIFKAKAPDPKPEPCCPPRLELQSYIIGNKRNEEIPEPGSIWECDKCMKKWELKFYEQGLAVWQEKK